MNDGNAKQQIVERIKDASSILVTVSRNPSVDGLSAALGLTLMLNKMDKHATAVMSGEIPPAISFLEPDKTFENSVSSLRDFIIALDKDKADRLRYKVEDDAVRIFITPYKTTITEKDLQFSQGDFNVDLIIALGVDRKDDLDNAITAHGRILHDASVVTINANDKKSELGSTDWTDSGASSLSEMLMSISEALQPNILDQQIATALLTGIVAATDRFANPNTKPRVMTMAAQLMAAGANQQLIAAKLEEGNAFEIHKETPKSEPKPEMPKPVEPEKTDDGKGEMRIEHAGNTDAPRQKQQPAPAPEPVLPKSPEDQLEEKLPVAPAAPTLTVDDLHKDIEAASHELDNAVTPEPKQPRKASAEGISQPKASDWRSLNPPDEPVLGGTLNATTQGAEEARREEEMGNRNRMILSHDRPRLPEPHDGDKPSWDKPMDMASPGDGAMPDSMNYEETPLPEPPRLEPAPVAAPILPPMPEPQPAEAPLPPMPPVAEPQKPMTLAEIEQQAHASHTPEAVADGANIESARAAVDAALNGQANPFEAQASIATQPIPEAPFTADPGLPPPPPMPDFSTLPPLPPDLSPPPPVDAPVPVDQEMPSPGPNQFKIPGQ